MPQILFLLVLFAGVASAHQQKEAFTSIVYNERSHNLEVVHRLLLHDAEEAARRLYGPEADLYKASNTRTQMGAYVIEHFALRYHQGERLPLRYVGHEIEGKYFWVYQELPISRPIKGLEIQNQILFDVWARQVNLVNVDLVSQTLTGQSLSSQTKSLTFRKGDSWRIILHNIVPTDGD